MITQIKTLLNRIFNNVQSKSITEIHQQKQTFTQIYNIPGHIPRQNSNIFNATHQKLIYDLDTPCYICGVSHSTLNNPIFNILGSSQMELHHRIEWSLKNALDINLLKKEYPDFNWSLVNPTDDDSWKFFIDSDICHRGKNHGVHALTGPIWYARKFIKKDFNFISNLQSKSLDNFVDDLS
jgi:hypothetical protein